MYCLIAFCLFLYLSERKWISVSTDDSPFFGFLRESFLLFAVFFNNLTDSDKAAVALAPTAAYRVFKSSLAFSDQGINSQSKQTQSVENVTGQ